MLKVMFHECVMERKKSVGKWKIKFTRKKLQNIKVANHVKEGEQKKIRQTD